MPVQAQIVAPQRYRASYGRYLEDFTVGDIYEHRPGRTITETDNIQFSLMTMNFHPMHCDAAFAAKSEFGRSLVNSGLTLAIVLGMTVNDVSGKAIANLGWTEIKLTAPVFPGDTLYAESEVLEKRESKSRPTQGIVTVHTRAFNQDGNQGDGIRAQRADSQARARGGRQDRELGGMKPNRRPTGSRRRPMPALAKSSPQVTHTLAEELSQFALQLSYHAIPATVRERAKHLILDSVGIALASTKYPFASISLSALEELGTGNSPVIGIGRRLALRDAVLMNGILIHGLDFDDTHSRGVIHATASSFPCALALTDRAEADGRTLLSAYVAAMEVATRLGSVAKGGFHQVGFHPTGLIGAFGCTLAAARILGLDPDRATMAQGIVLSMASGSLEFLEDGAWTKRMHPGWAGVAGITAATLAKHGFVGPSAAYDGRFGLYASHLGNHFEKADLGLATENLGRSWQIDEVAVKPIPACHFTHAAADAAIALHAAYGLSNKDIRRVRALVPQEVVKTVCEPVANKRNPANSYDAQFSIPYIVATGLLKGRFTLAELEDEALHRFRSAQPRVARRVRSRSRVDLSTALHRRGHRGHGGRTLPASPRGD